jgi:hypothetical protein
MTMTIKQSKEKKKESLNDNPNGWNLDYVFSLRKTLIIPELNQKWRRERDNESHQ